MQPMKTRRLLLKLTIILCFTFATTVVFGQTLIWTNALLADPNGNNIGVSTNWSGPAGPGLNSPVSGTTLTFNGTVPGSLVLYQDDGINHNGGNLVGGSAGASGVQIHLTSGQTSPVQLSSRAFFSANMSFNALTIDTGAGQFTLGDNTTQVLATVGRPAGATHDWINNSTNPVIICPNVEWQNGGGAAFTVLLDGTGDYGITNSLGSSASGTITYAILTTGTVTWNGPSLPSLQIPIIPLGSPFTINAGILVLKTNGLLASQNITNNGAIPAKLVYDGNSPQTLGGVISGPISLTVKSGTLTLSGANTYTGGTIVSNGVLQVGNGGTKGTIGSGNVTNGSSLVFNRSDNVTFANVISGGGSVVQQGSGTLTLAGANTYTGPTTVSNGTMAIAGGVVGGDMNVSGGTLVPSSVGSIGTLNVASNLNLNSGAILITVNKSLSSSNSIFVATNVVATGGAVKLVNYGPAFVPGDRFVIFRQVDGVTPKPVSGGLSMTVTAPGVTSFINNLAVDGSVTVSAVTATPMAFTSAVQSGGNISLSWPSVWTGVHLQSQTNMLTVGLSTNWVTIVGTDAANGYTNTLNSTNGSVFYRLVP